MEYEECNPTWEAAVTIHLQVVENPLAHPMTRENARKEIRKAGHLVDILQQKLTQAEALLSEHHAAGIFEGIGAGDDCPVCKKFKEKS
jgi:hypothetical protein